MFKNLNSQCETKNHYAKTCPERSRMGQNSVDRWIICFSGDMLAYIANTYGTSFIQTHISLQLSRTFYKSAYFYAKQSQFLKKSNGCKVNYIKWLWEKNEQDTWWKQTQTKPIPNQRTEGRRQMAELDNGSKNWATLRSSYKKTLLFALNLVKWTLGEMRKKQIWMLDTGCWILDLIPLSTASIENRVSRFEFWLCIE